MKEVPGKIAKYLSSTSYVSVEDLVERFGYKKTTAYAYLSRLSKKGKVSRVGCGKYRVGKIQVAEPPLPPRVKEVANVILKKMPFSEFVVWGTENLADFSHYVVGRDVVFVEAKNQLVPKIVDTLLEGGVKAIVEPSKEEFKNLFTYFDRPVVVFKRREKYAAVKKSNLLLPRLERTLVDQYYCITRRGFPFPLDEFGRIFYNVLRDRVLNIDMLKKYASRRGLRDEMSALIVRFKEEYPELEMWPQGEKGASADLIEEIVKGAT